MGRQLGLSILEGGGKGPGSSTAQEMGCSLKCLWCHLMTANPIVSQAGCSREESQFYPGW